MNDMKPHEHGDEGPGSTHWACEARMKKEGGEAKCCECCPHDGCGHGLSECCNEYLEIFADVKRCSKCTKVYMKQCPRCNGDGFLQVRDWPEECIHPGFESCLVVCSEDAKVFCPLCQNTGGHLHTPPSEQSEECPGCVYEKSDRSSQHYCLRHRTTPPSEQLEEKIDCTSCLHQAATHRPEKDYLGKCHVCSCEMYSNIRVSSTPPKAEGVGELELREEWNEYAGGVAIEDGVLSIEETADWWMEKLTSATREAVNASVKAAEERKDGEWRNKIADAIQEARDWVRDYCIGTPDIARATEAAINDFEYALLPPPTDKPTQHA